jgi:Tol biopolymer transport system component/DNA-binding winged helix-turn-helix (wHTH) protein
MVEKDPPNGQRIRFATFEVDLRAGEVRKSGIKLKLSGQPLQVLTILLERPGEVVTREDLQKRLWPDTFVDVDHNLNTAINKIREALGDSAESPRFVETLPRRGYRFIAPVEGGFPVAVQDVEKAPPPKSKGRAIPLSYGLALLSIVIVAVGALAVWKLVSRTPGEPRVVRFTKLTNDGQAKKGQLATDGSRIYFNELLPNKRSLIAQVSVRGGEVVPLSVPFNLPQMLDLSKDGTELLVASGGGGWEVNGLSEHDERNSTWVQPVAGGSPRRVGAVMPGDPLFAEGPGMVVSPFTEDARFGADSTKILFASKHDIYSVDTNGSLPKKLLTAEGVPFAFRFSPDARVFRFTLFDYPTETATIFEANADGTGVRGLFPGCCGEWTPDGRFFIFASKVESRSDLWISPAQRSLSWRKQGASPTQLTTGPLNFRYPLPSKDGKEIFAIGDSRRAEVIRYDSRSGEFVPYLSGISAEGLAFTRDGQWVAYASYPEGTLWRSKVDGSERLQLTFPPMRVVMPRWSPDGKQIAFSALVPQAPWNIYRISSRGGTAHPILPSNQIQLDVDWSPDGNSLVFGSAIIPNTPIYIIDLRSRRVSILPDSNGFFSPHWSPDGRYMSATTIATDKLILFDFSTQKWTQVNDSQVGSSVGFPVWSHDGKYLYFKYYPAPDVPYRIVRLRLSDRKVENVAELGNVGRWTIGTHGQWFGLAPDDSPLFARDISTQEIYSLEMDWP